MDIMFCFTHTCIQEAHSESIDFIWVKAKFKPAPYVAESKAAEQQETVESSSSSSKNKKLKKDGGKGAKLDKEDEEPPNKKTMKKEKFPLKWWPARKISNNKERYNY
jgi:hypothetical protein